MTVTRAVRIPITGTRVPLGVARLAGTTTGVDLDEHGYVEEEFLVDGTASEWTYDRQGVAVPAASAVGYTTRVLVRRPADPARFNGVVQIEPLHPSFDLALTWRAIHPWIMRTGAVWVGVTQDARFAACLSTVVDPERYAAITVPRAGLGYDIVGGVGVAIRSATVGILDGFPHVERAYLSGWSMTGSFCRVFLGDGFARRHCLPDGTAVFDGYLIAVSSGGAVRAGYPPLSAGARGPGPGDARRTIGPHGIPVIELLSELESETHTPSLRADSDGTDDPYRLYQVAGTAHNTSGPTTVLTNLEQCRRRGLDVGRSEINESPSDARMDYLARAVFALLDRWVTERRPPPRAERFTFAGTPLADERIPPGARPLARDRHGNVLGGIRTPWVEVPVARYSPHSTPRPGACTPSPLAPMTDANQVAAMIGHMVPFPPGTLRSLYPSRADYLTRYWQSCRRLADLGFLLSEEMTLLIDEAGIRQHVR